MRISRYTRMQRMFRTGIWFVGIGVFLTAYGFSWLLVI